MNIGQFKSVIYVQSYTRSVDAAGDSEQTWKTIYILYAKKRFVRGNEAIIDDQRTAISTVIFTIRYRKGITESCRILHDDEYYSILSINEIAQGQFIEITTEKQTKETVF